MPQNPKKPRLQENAMKLSTSTDREIVIERVFDAPRELVFAAYTDPNRIPHWWGPRNTTTKVDRMEVRVGGAWRFVNVDEKGNEFGFHGVYREVVPLRRLVSTFEFEGMPGHVAVETATFEDRAGKTKVTVKSLFENKEDRDGMIASGMEAGARESWERLAELLSKEI